MKSIQNTFLGVVVGGVVLLLPSAGSFAAEEKVTLALGGQYCNYYPDDIKRAIRSVPGVASVHFNSDKSKVIVTGGKMDTAKLVTAVNKVKGDGWYCEAKMAH